MDRIVRYLSGESPPSEAAEVRAWAEADPAHARELRVAEEAWRRALERPEEESSRPGWERIAARLGGQPAGVEAIPIRPRLVRDERVRRNGTWRRAGWTRWAAAIVLLIGVTALWSPLRDALNSEPRPQSYATAVGQRATITLADGSRVLLAPESELRFSGKLRRGSRDVELRGAAYFEVESDRARPFRVHAKDAITQVLGTRFMIRAYDDEESVDVGVEEGTVAVRTMSTPENEAVILEVGEGVRVETDGSTRRVDREAVEALLGWKDGRLAYRDAPVATVLHDLEHWYGVVIRLDDPDVADRLVTISFDYDQSLEAFNLLAATLDQRLERSGRVIHLRPTGPSEIKN